MHANQEGRAELKVSMLIKGGLEIRMIIQYINLRATNFHGSRSGYKILKTLGVNGCLEPAYHDDFVPQA